MKLSREAYHREQRLFNQDMKDEKDNCVNLSLREKIHRSVRDDITYGRLRPGEHLGESRLAREFKTSRGPVREALHQLEMEGIITFEQNKGITVSKLSISEVEEIYGLRSLLEGYAVRLAAERATKYQITYLKDLHRKMRVAAKNNDFREWLQNNTLFHNFFTENSENKILAQMIENIKRRVYRYKFITVRIPGHFGEYLRHHEWILKGCEAHDGEMAEKHMRLHIETIRKALVDYLGKFPEV